LYIKTRTFNLLNCAILGTHSLTFTYFSGL